MITRLKSIVFSLGKTLGGGGKVRDPTPHPENFRIKSFSYILYLGALGHPFPLFVLVGLT